jgi:hypothetical protein
LLSNLSIMEAKVVYLKTRVENGIPTVRVGLAYFSEHLNGMMMSHHSLAKGERISDLLRKIRLNGISKQLYVS